MMLSRYSCIRGISQTKICDTRHNAAHMRLYYLYLLLYFPYSMFSICIVFTTAITYTVMNRYTPSTIGASPTNLFSLQEFFNTIFFDKGEIAHKRFYHWIGVGIPTFLIDNLPARILRTSVAEAVRQCFPYFALYNLAQISAILTFVTLIPATNARTFFSQCFAAHSTVQPAWGNLVSICCYTFHIQSFLNDFMHKLSFIPDGNGFAYKT